MSKIKSSCFVGDSDKPFFLLVVDSLTSPFCETLRQTIGSSHAEFNVCVSERKALMDNMTLLQKCVLVIAELSGKNKAEVFDLLIMCRKLFKRVPRILVAGDKLDINWLSRAVNEAGVSSLFRMDEVAGKLPPLLFKSLAGYSEILSYQELLGKTKSQNRQLEELTEGLEGLVKERTRSADISKQEAENKLARMRSVVHFVKELGGLGALEDLMVLLRREMRRFHKVAEPHLALPVLNGRLKHLFFRGGQYYERWAQKAWNSDGHIRMNDKADSYYLANEIGRPFGQVIAFPLPVRIERSGEESSYFVPPTLFLEHSLSVEEVDEFLSFARERLQSVSLALDRILLEKELLRSSHLWESTFDGIGDPVAIVSDNFEVLRANKKFYEERLQTHCYKNFADLQTPCAGCPMQSSIEQQRPYAAQIRAGGRVFMVHSYPIQFDKPLRSTTVVNHYFDVTRSSELQSRMIQNEKMAALGHLAGHIAHELNNPLTGIRSLSQVLMVEQKTRDSLVKDLTEVENAAKRCQSIIENLLSFSESDQDAELERVSVNQVLQNTLPLVKTVMSDFRREIELTEESTDVYAKPQLIQQVLFNLLNNASQAMRGLKGTISLRTYIETVDDQDWVCIDVVDEGPGISEEYITSIFEPFFTTKPEGEGTGLGLSMSKKIIEGFGGAIGVTSKVGKGTCFQVRLPAI